MQAQEKEWFVYLNGNEHRPISGNTTVDSIFHVFNDAPFVISSTQQRVNTTSTGTIQFVATGNFNAPPILVQWLNDAGKLWMQPQFSVPVDSVYGDGRRPHYLKYMLAVPANTNFILRATNQTAATDMYLYLVHEGFKDFPDERVGGM